MLKKSHFVLVLLLSFTLISTASCKQDASSDYPVLESGYNAFSEGGSKTYWIDNDRVIFYGYKPGQNEDRRGEAIHIWDTKVRKVDLYARLDKHSSTSFCFGDNVIAYFKEQIEDGIEGFAYMEGPLGQERETTSFQDHFENGRKNPYTCRIEAPPPELKDHRWRPLKPEHGYLDYGPRLFPDQADPALYYLRKDGKRVKLPVGKDTWSIKGYYPHKQAYLLLSNRQGISFDKNVLKKNLNQPRIKTCLDGYWLFPDGKTEQICILFSKTWATKAPLPSILFNTGILVSANRPTGRDRISGAEQYLLSEGQLKKLINGSMAAVSISPDGCSIAFAHAQDWDDIRQGRQLKTINTCK